MNNRWIRYVNMAVINFILLFACLAFSAYYGITSRSAGVAVIAITLLVLCVVLNVTIFLIRKAYRVRRAKTLAVYADGEKTPVTGAVSDMQLPVVFLAEDGAFI